MLEIREASDLAELAEGLSEGFKIFIEVHYAEGKDIGFWVGSDDDEERKVTAPEARATILKDIDATIEGVDPEDTFLGMMPNEYVARLKAAKSCISAMSDRSWRHAGSDSRA